MDILGITKKIKAYGLRKSGRVVYRRIFPRRCVAITRFSAAFRNATAIEVGGPTGDFGSNGLVPVYPKLKRLDNVNFANFLADIKAASAASAASRAAHGGAVRPLKDDSEFRERLFGQVGGSVRQYSLEATELRSISDDTYDLLLSSHMIEHSANPIKVLHEFQRVVRAGGMILLVAPNKETSSDRLRPTTSLQHMISDFEKRQSEDDLTHLEEYLTLTDWDMVTAAGGQDRLAIEPFARNNLANRCIHHHTFTRESLRCLLDYAGLEVLAVAVEEPWHLIALSKVRP